MNTPSFSASWHAPSRPPNGTNTLPLQHNLRQGTRLHGGVIGLVVFVRAVYALAQLHRTQRLQAVHLHKKASMVTLARKDLEASLCYRCVEGTSVEYAEELQIHCEAMCSIWTSGHAGLWPAQLG